MIKKQSYLINNPQSVNDLNSMNKIMNKQNITIKKKNQKIIKNKKNVPAFLKKTYAML